MTVDPTRSPLAWEFFSQWQRARGARTEPAQRPFSRSWEELLEDARIVSATERADAEHDARLLEAGDWVELTSVKYRPHLLDRIVLPLGGEARWMEAFGFVRPPESEARLIREFAWEPPLAFLREARVNIPFDELRRINKFIGEGGAGHELVPIKERSLQIFGDEKRLDVLFGTALFRPDRLDLKRDLGCELIGVPIAWKRGPVGAASRPLIVIENAATWHTYCRWNAERELFSAVVYGDGNRFADGIRYMADIFAELGGLRHVLYFGDLDPQGVLIPQEASARSSALCLPAVEPHLWSYRTLLAMSETRAQTWTGDLPPSALCDWLQECSGRAWQLFANGRRLAQEHIGWDCVRVLSGRD